MLNKKVVKDIQSLALKKARQESGLFVAEGPKVVNELLTAIPSALIQLYATSEWSVPADLSLPIVNVTGEELKKLSHLSTPSQVVAVFQQQPQKAPSPSGVALYLDTIQDPGNLGTILRIADWFGISDVVCSPGCADRYQPKVVQATMASLARVNVYEDGSADWLFTQRRMIIAATLHGRPLKETQKMDNGILLIGNESKGVRASFLEKAAMELTIPRRGGAESLNAAVATGIILSHLLH